MWYKIQDQQVKLQIVAKPHAKKTAIIKISERGIHIAIHAKPHKGEANKELLEFLAEFFGVPKSQVNLQTGEGSKYKQVIIPLTVAIQKILDDLPYSIS